MAERFIDYPVDMEFKGFDEFQALMKEQGFANEIRNAMRQKNRALALLGKAKLVNTMLSGQFAPNSPVTIALKKSSKPLVNHGDLVGNVGARSVSWQSFHVGIKRVTPRGQNLAHMLETGFTIRVTPAMRRWFFYQAKESGGKFKPLRESTTVLKVPARPYMRAAFFEDESFAQFVHKEWLGVIDTIMQKHKVQVDSAGWKKNP